MFDSKMLRPGDRFLLAYDHVGGTIPPDRIVTILDVNDERFTYRIERIWAVLPRHGIIGFVDKALARRLGMRFREGRSIMHADFATNMRRRSTWAAK